MSSLICCGLYYCVIGSRILGGYALKGGMPVCKYISNHVQTLVGNVLMGAKLSECHTGNRAFSRRLLKQFSLEVNSDDFVLDNRMLARIPWYGYAVAEVSCPTEYFPDVSSINFGSSVHYGFGCLTAALSVRLAKLGLMRFGLFPAKVGQ